MSTNSIQYGLHTIAKNIRLQLLCSQIATTPTSPHTLHSHTHTHFQLLVRNGITHDPLIHGGDSEIEALQQACHIWLQSGSDWHQMGQIRGFFRSYFSTFWLVEKSRICPIWEDLGQILP